MRLLLALFGVLVLISPGWAAGEFDGLWKPIPIRLPGGSEIDPYHCIPSEPNGAILVEGDAYGEVEGWCRMANPVAVRDMNATLFDVTCQGDWGSRTDRQLFMLYRDKDDRERLLIVDPSGSSEWERCE